MNNILTIQNIHTHYGAIHALKNIRLSIAEGTIAALIGANGSGKSTLLRSITGLVPVSSGSILFDGAEIANSSARSLSADKIARLGIAMVPEGRGIFSGMTVLENLEMGAYMVRDKKKAATRLKENYDLFPIIHDRKYQKAGSLSGGEQQMLAIARALMSSPKLLLLDEPSLGLAPMVIHELFQTIQRINQEDKVTVFLVEQNARMALQNSSTAFVMETGEIVLEDSSHRLLENERVKAAYLGT